MICGVLNAVVRVANCIVANTLSPSLQLPLFSCTASFAVEVLLVAYVLYASRKFILGGGRRRLIVTVPAEASTSWTTTKVVDELKLQDPKDPRVIKLYDPCSGYVLGKGTARAMDAADVKAVVAKARAAQPAWAASSFETRRELLRLLMDYIVEHQEEICRVASRDTGKTMVDGAFGEVLTTCEKLRWTVENGEKALAPEHRGVGALAMHKSARVEYHPMGVLGAIIPWNYPFHNMYGQLISALFAGNAIVIKVSEHATWSAEYYLSIVHAALKAVGHSPDLVQIVTGYAEAGNALINSGVDKVTFIGSPGVGKLVMKAAADTLTPVVLELGGKDAAVICEDCDYDQVVNLTLRGTFQNCGQNCIGLERLVVHEKIYDRFVQFMEREVNKLTQGAPMNNCFDCGAMTMGVAQVAKIQHLVDDAVKKGARLLAGGKVNTKVGGPGTFYTPTLLADVTPAMEIAQEEVFGPVMVIMKSKDDQDSIRLVNSSQYGLGSSVFSKDYARAERIARAIRAGMSNINDFGVNYLCQSLPFGGVNISGFDRFAGIEGLRGCCLLKAVTSDKTFIRTTIPPPLQYPIMASGFKFCEAMINMFYGDGLAARAKGLFNLARISLSKKK